MWSSHRCLQVTDNVCSKEVRQMNSKLDLWSNALTLRGHRKIFRLLWPDINSLSQQRKLKTCYYQLLASSQCSHTKFWIIHATTQWSWLWLTAIKRLSTFNFCFCRRGICCLLMTQFCCCYCVAFMAQKNYTIFFWVECRVVRNVIE